MVVTKILAEAQALGNIDGYFPAPINALAYNNIIINGGMDVDQVNVGALVSGINGYAVDGYQVLKTGTMVLASQQVADAPAGLTNSLKVTVTTSEASLAAGDYAIILANIEGYRTARLSFGNASAQSVSVGFWAKAHRTGTYTATLQNSAANRSNPINFTVNLADTWEYKTLTFIGDQAGTWVGATNGIGLRLYICMGAGTTFQGTNASWNATNVFATSSTVNGVAATSDTFQVTGVSLLPGTQAQPSARSSLIIRPFADELLLCQRYYFKTWNYSTVPFTSDINGVRSATGEGNARIWGDFTYIVEMKSTPTVTSYGGGTTGRFEAVGGAATAAMSATATGTKAVAYFSGTCTTGNIYYGHFVADARL